MSRYLIGVLTPNYVQRAVPFIRSLSVVRSAKVCIVLLDFTPETDPDGNIERQLRQVPWVEWRHMALPPTHSNFMIQDSFMTTFPEIADRDTVILSDADVIVQRDVTPEEWAEFELNAFHRINVWHNAGPTDSLAMEAQRIGLSQEWIDRFVPMKVGLVSLPCKNCGVMVADAGTFRKVQEWYREFYGPFAAASSHRSRCQFLLNFCWYMMGLEVVTLPPAIHQHGHSCSADGAVLCADGTELVWDVLVVKGTPVVFRHNL